MAVPVPLSSAYSLQALFLWIGSNMDLISAVFLRILLMRYAAQ